MTNRSQKKVLAAPEGMRIYAIGDIHGCSKELDQLTTSIVRDSADAPDSRAIVYLGDYIDRGPDSKGVLDRLLNPPSGFAAYHVRGNHDQVMLDFLADPAVYREWGEFGGRETLASYGVAPPRGDDGAYARARDRLLLALPPRHLDFLNRLPLSVTLGDYLFVHAGIRPGIALGNQSLEDLMWIRNDFLDSTEDFGTVVVHGHTPGENPVRRANRIGVDTGCYASGRLTAAVLEGTTCRFLRS